VADGAVVVRFATAVLGGRAGGCGPGAALWILRALGVSVV